MPRILPAARRQRLAWKNGGGFAAEVAWKGVGTEAVPFDWRVTLADIVKSGPFSDFTGVDRVLQCASSGGLRLVVDGVDRELAAFDTIVFDGEARVESTGVSGPALALNLLLRRGAAVGSLETKHVRDWLDVQAGAGEAIAVVVDGRVRFDDRDLALHDAVRWSGGSASFAGSGIVTIARVALVEG